MGVPPLSLVDFMENPITGYWGPMTQETSIVRIIIKKNDQLWRDKLFIPEIDGLFKNV